MKRIVILIDGTWNDEKIDKTETNVAELSWYEKLPGQKFLIKNLSSKNVPQVVKYFPGVTGFFGGTIGYGLKKIIEEAYEAVVDEYESGDEIYLFGFSRGAYAVRALASVIGTSGIRHKTQAVPFDTIWNHTRVARAVRENPATAGSSDKKAIDRFNAAREQGAIKAFPTIKLVGVWDTVGSYGIPAGFGFEAVANYISSTFLGFKDTMLGDYVENGLHAVAVDEKRRPFTPTLWTAPDGRLPKGHVEQTWFAGVHCNVGGGYDDSGLSDIALAWMIARTQKLTDFEFDIAAVKTAITHANIDGEIYNSIQDYWGSRFINWITDSKGRTVLATENNLNINERVHWSVIKKRGRPCTIDGTPNTPYNPPNLPTTIPSDKIAPLTPEERELLASTTVNPLLPAKVDGVS
jgi:uncharacterized protein (DUF2235 family)